jgi:hypothetical protein
VSALIAGLDISSKRIDAALIPLDPDDGSDAPPVTLRQYLMPTEKQMRGIHEETTPARRSVERCRVIRDAMRELLLGVPYFWERPGYFRDKRGEWTEHEVVHVCVEEPFGPNRKADNVLREIYGAILASIPPHIERDTIGTQEWRRIIWPNQDEWASVVGGVDWKERACLRAFGDTGLVLDEHQSEAFLIAHACRARLERDTKSAA